MEGPLPPAVFGQQCQEELWGLPPDSSSSWGFPLGELYRGLAYGSHWGLDSWAPIDLLSSISGRGSWQRKKELMDMWEET